MTHNHSFHPVNPVEITPRDVSWFGALLLAFFGALGVLIFFRGASLVTVGTFLSAAWLISLIFNRADSKGHLLGVVLPAVCLAIGGSVTGGIQPLLVASVVWATGGLLGLLVLTWPGFGRHVYVGWMQAALPIGWTVSHLVLAIAYYLVLTPAGLIMRLCGHDPMQRNFESEVETYWSKHNPIDDTARYFRQF